MKRILLFLLVFNITSAVFSQILYPDLTGQELIDQLRADFKPAKVLSYDIARDSMYAIIDNENDYVTCVYTGYTIYLNPSADPSTDAYNQDINAEHTWPQSMGADEGNANSDLHHLYPTRMQVNSSRGNDPFKDIPDYQTDTWWRNDYSQSTIPGSNIDDYSEKATGWFEPREDHKGNVARAVFYFYTMYKEQSDTNFFNIQKETLRTWNLIDDVDLAELDRSAQVAHFQSGKENPFVLDTTLARRAYFMDSGSSSDTTITSNPAAIIITEIMQNPTAVADDNGEWFEIYNNSNEEIDINGWYIRDADTESHQISNGGPLLIQPGAYSVIGRNANSQTNGGVSISYQYSDIALGNSGDELILVSSDGNTEIDRVEYDDGGLWPDPSGASLYFNQAASSDNNLAVNWQVSGTTWVGSAGDFGTPGYGDFTTDLVMRKQYVPEDYQLSNHPNPFNPFTLISYQLKKSDYVHLAVYDILGKHVEDLVHERQPGGTYQVRFEAKNRISGIYFAVLNTSNSSSVIKLCLLK